MAIVIKKGGAAQRSAPVVDGALKADPKPKEAIPASWKDVPPPGAKTKECPYCKQWYIKPCDAAKHGKCQNFLHLKGKPA